MKRILFLIGLLISCENVELQPPIQEWEVAPIEIDWIVGDQIINQINLYRESIGLNRLIKDPGLPSYLGAQHCNYMIEQGRISHDNFIERAHILSNYGADAVGENVAFGFHSGIGVVNAWLNSPDHKDIIEGNYNKIGLGIIYDNYGTQYVCALLIRI